MYDEFTPSDITYFQKYLDLFYEKQALRRRINVPSLIYKGTSN
jgi:NitT/TauT family transport system substrate-binding protein